MRLPPFDKALMFLWAILFGAFFGLGTAWLTSGAAVHEPICFNGPEGPVCY